MKRPVYWQTVHKWIHEYGNEARNEGRGNFPYFVPCAVASWLSNLTGIWRVTFIYGGREGRNGVPLSSPAVPSEKKTISNKKWDGILWAKEITEAKCFREIQYANEVQDEISALVTVTNEFGLATWSWSCYMRTGNAVVRSFESGYDRHATAPQKISLRNCGQQPYWALHTDCGKCWCKGTEHIAGGK
jgi:hypothetical protein